MDRPALMFRALMAPGKLEAKAMNPSPPSAVNLFWNAESPDTSRPSIFFIPPPVVVSIFMLGLIQLMLPLSVIMDSPADNSHTTTGRLPPKIS